MNDPISSGRKRLQCSPRLVWQQHCPVMLILLLPANRAKSSRLKRRRHNMKCQGCPLRTADCHSTCPSYLRYERRRRKKLEKEADARSSLLLRRVKKAEGKITT